MRQRIISGIIGLVVVLSVYQTNVYAGAAGVKGKWRRVVPIAEDNHPNLYYNRSEIDELRKMILVNRSPRVLVDHYNAWCKWSAPVIGPPLVRVFHIMTRPQLLAHS